MKRLNFTFSFTGYDIIDENNNFIKSRKAPSYVDFQKLRSSCDIGLSTVMIRKDIFKNAEYRFANLRTKEDYVLWLKLAKDKIDNEKHPGKFNKLEEKVRTRYLLQLFKKL